MGEFLRAVFLGLIPPDTGAEPRLIQRWRINISITVGVLVVTVIGNIVLGWGLLPVIFPGFALASDNTDTNKMLVQVRVSQLETEIFDAHEKECEAIIAKNRDLAVQYEQRVQSKLPVYQRLNNGQPYQLQSCPGG